MGADAIICSAYKFFGPHLGVMAMDKDRLKELQPSKVGVRFSQRGLEDLLDYGPVPNTDNCEVSRWEMGTLNYEALAGFEACVEYLASLAPFNGDTSLEAAFDGIRNHEEELSSRFLDRIQPLIEENRIRLFGSRDPTERTPT